MEKKLSLSIKIKLNYLTSLMSYDMYETLILIFKHCVLNNNLNSFELCFWYPEAAIIVTFTTF